MYNRIYYSICWCLLELKKRKLELNLTLHSSEIKIQSIKVVVDKLRIVAILQKSIFHFHKTIIDDMK